MTAPPDTRNDDRRYMARALRLAEQGLFTTDPNPRVGCVLVKDGRIVGEGCHRRVGGPHAEVEALAAAHGRTHGATAFVTLEPCCHHGKTPPCTEALIAAGVTRVVAAMEDPDPRVAGKGLALLRASGIRTECGLLGDAAAALNPGFCSRMRTGKPFLRSKLAMSLDGRTALASGESRWITSEDSRRDVHRLRARSSAIITGIETVLADDPSLTARLETGEDVLQPARIVLDSALRMPLSAKMLQQPGRTVIVTLTDDLGRAAELEDKGAEVHVLAQQTSGARIDVRALMQYLGRNEYNEVLVEAGATLNGSLLSAGLVDEWIVYMAPCVLGDQARGLFRIDPLQRMDQRHELKITDLTRVGPDVRLRLRPAAALATE